MNWIPVYRKCSSVKIRKIRTPGPIASQVGLEPGRAPCSISVRARAFNSMKSPNSANLPGLEDKTFLLLVIAVSLAFAWILWPFFGAVLWGTILAILFAPLYRRLLNFYGA